MAAVIWVLTWLPQLLSAMSELPKPDNVKINSTNFIHVLSWESGTGTPSGVHYQVSVHPVRGSSWLPVAGCQHVELPLVCNVTEAFPDPADGYITRVTALLGARVSQPANHQEFVPIRHTHLDLPRLTVTPCGKSLCVGLHPPVERVKENYDDLKYTLNLKSSSTGPAQVIKDNMSLKGEVLTDLAPGRQYCISVRFSDSKSNYSQPQCVFTTEAHTADPAVASGILLSVMLMFALVLLVRTGVCFLREPLPPVLTSIHNMEEVLVAEPCSTSSSSPLYLDSTPPSTGGKGNGRASSDESEGETGTESGAGSAGGGGYKEWGGAHLLSDPSSSSLSLPSPLPEPGLLPDSVFLPSEEHACSSHLSPFSTVEPQPGAAISTLTTPTTPHSASLSNGSDAVEVLTAWGVKPNQVEEEGGEGSGQDVNLISLTFGRKEDEEKLGVKRPDEAEPASLSNREEPPHNHTALLPSHTKGTEEVAMETFSTFVTEEEEEEEEEESCGYPTRPCTNLVELPPGGTISTDIHSTAGSHHAPTKPTTPHSAFLPNPSDAFDVLTAGGVKPNVEEGRGQDVNLISLTFGGKEDEENLALKREEPPHNATPLLPSQTKGDEEVAMETVSTFIEEEQEEEEEEEEECSGYLTRPRQPQNLP